MQATNKSDATQVYEEMVKTSKVGSKGFFKYILKPLTIFSYHYFLEGIKAVQKRRKKLHNDYIDKLYELAKISQ